MGIGDWGLGIGDWGLGPIPNPQSPIPNPQSPSILKKTIIILNKINFNLIILSLIYKIKFIKNIYSSLICIIAFGNSPSSSRVFSIFSNFLGGKA